MDIIKNLSSCTVLLFCLSSGCSNHPGSSSRSSIAANKQQNLKQAKILLNYATRNESNYAQDYQLKAAEHFILADELEKAKNLLEAIEATNHEQSAFKNILQAQIELLNQRPKVALALLQNIWRINDLHSELQIKLLKTRITSYLRLGNSIDAVENLILVDHLLISKYDKNLNSQKIFNILGQLTPHSLNELKHRKNESSLNGWINFVYITKQYDTSPAQMSRAIVLWKQHYPNHPANEVIPKNIDLTMIEEPEKSKKIGLLLPLSGPYASSAEVIKNGFITSYYQHLKSTSVKSEIKIYDTTKYGGVTMAYNSAIKDKVDFIVGPLIKEDVETLYSRSTTSIPLLALNTISLESYSKPPENFFQFGLPPETEAIAIAEKSKQDGHRNALIFIPDNELGQRITKAFNSHWEAFDNKIIATLRISEKSDLNGNIRKILGIEDSENRAQDLKRLGIKLTYEPRRRQDIDTIFLATNPTLARQIKPLLNFHYAGELPIYATSSIYTGKPLPGSDQDLNGIKFCDMPWILDKTVKSRSTHTTISKLWSNDLEQMPRLFALGIDAYKLTSQIQQLNMFPDFGISGMTGLLKLDNKQRIQRQFMWATFKAGRPIVY